MGQTGEYLVAAELSRRGLIATTFTGNVPHYDIIASDEKGSHVAVQVKTKGRTGGAWQFGDVSQFVAVRLERPKQVVGRVKRCPIQQLVYVFVELAQEDKPDRFFILTWGELRDTMVAGHRRYLKKHNNQRPKKWDSLHCAVKVEALAQFEDRWGVIVDNLH